RRLPAGCSGSPLSSEAGRSRPLRGARAPRSRQRPGAGARSQAARVVATRDLVRRRRAAAVQTVDLARDDAGHEPAHDRRDGPDLRVALAVPECDATGLEVVAVVVPAVASARTRRAGK